MLIRYDIAFSETRQHVLYVLIYNRNAHAFRICSRAWSSRMMAYTTYVHIQSQQGSWHLHDWSV
eukprot:COSAG01_NODE_61962_length_287_cov_0.510638_1_plen_63_part_01